MGGFFFGSWSRTAAAMAAGIREKILRLSISSIINNSVLVGAFVAGSDAMDTSKDNDSAATIAGDQGDIVG